MGHVGGAPSELSLSLLKEQGYRSEAVGSQAASNSCHCLLPAERPSPRNRGAEARQTDTRIDRQQTEDSLAAGSRRLPLSLPPAPGG